jgi:hypothetical protein
MENLIIPKYVIIIPYRKREKHLNFFIDKTYPILSKYLNFKLVIVEQSEGKKFNRGKLINIGFHLNSSSDWIITQDVDINPKEHIIKDIYSLDESIIGIYTSSCNTLGGIVKISKEHYKKMNGFTNDYWGWGCEDKNLQNRAEFFKIPIKKNYEDNYLDITSHFDVFNDIVDKELDKQINYRTNFEYNKFGKLSDDLKMQSIMSSGLNTLEYDIIDIYKISDNIEKIKVSI